MNDPKTADQIKWAELYQGTIPQTREEILADYYEWGQRLVRAECILERLGWRRCDIPACNCNGYHKRDEPAALRLLVEKWRNEASAYFKAIDKHPSYEDVAFELKSNTLRQCAKELEEALSGL